MIRTNKIQCFPNQTQKEIIYKTLGACRWIYNQYLGYNRKIYEEEKRFVSENDFSGMLTQLKKTSDEYKWLNGISRKAVCKSVSTAEKAFESFFKKKTGFPKFKSKKSPVQSYYLYPVKCKTKQNKIKLPLLGWMCIRENDYVPKAHILHARLVVSNVGKFYITLTYDDNKDTPKYEPMSPALGIDVGIKNYVSIASANGENIQIESLVNCDYVKRLNEKKLKLERIISNKAEINYGKLLNVFVDKNHREPNEIEKKIIRKESYRSTQINKVRLKINRINKKITDFKIDRINKLVNKLVKNKPKYITIENLSIKEMVSKTRDDHKKSLSRYIMQSKFYYLFQRIIWKCKVYGVELRIANKYFASSKKCSECGHKKKDLTLDDRVYVCDECGLKIDRDLNAAINLLNTDDYTIIV